ncbi:hypothetical protein REPUB_Repub06bG0114600 [Reevesia pubescens]
MNPAEWWMIYGTCVPELQNLAIKVLSQTTSTSNCERNWSTFSYIHTKARNRLKYDRLQKLVFTYYNMRLKMRHQQRVSIDEMNNSFNSINLDHIFEDDDPLSEWLQEKENPLLDGQSVLPADIYDDEMNVERSHQSQEQNASHSSSSPTPSQSDDGGEGLSPPDDDDAGGAADFSGHVGDNTPYSPLGREYGHDATHGLFIDMSDYARIPSVESSGARTERRSQSKGKGKKHQHDNS